MYYDEVVDPPGIIDYQWTIRDGFEFPAAVQVADDVHRVTDDPLVGVALGYHARGPIATIPLDLFIYANNASDTLLPTANPIWSGRFMVPSGGYGSVYLPLPEPIEAPRDLWIGFKFDVSNYRDVGFMIPYGWEPAIGSSDSLLMMWDFDGDGVPDDVVLDSNRKFMLQTYSEPGGLPTPGAGTVLLIGALAGRRRR